MEPKIIIKDQKTSTQNNMVQSAIFKNCEKGHWQEVLQFNHLPFPESS